MTTLADIVTTTVDDKLTRDGDTPATVTTYVDAIPVASVVVDDTYQRPLDRARVQRMAAEYDPHLVGILEVSARDDGSYAVIDGQHRWAMVRLAHPLGDRAHVACNVHTGLTVETEAQLFFDIDKKRRRLTGWDRWNARRGAGEQTVLDIERVAADHDYTVQPGTTEGSLRCASALEKVVATGGLQLLDTTLGTVRASYGDSTDGTVAEIVHGVALVLQAYTHDELDIPRLVTAMTGIVPRQLVARATALREVQKGQLPRLVASILIDRYNAEPGANVPSFVQRVAPQSKAKKTGA